MGIGAATERERTAEAVVVVSSYGATEGTGDSPQPLRFVDLTGTQEKIAVTDRASEREKEPVGEGNSDSVLGGGT